MTVVRPLQRPLHREAGGASVSGNVEAWHNRGGFGVRRLLRPSDVGTGWCSPPDNVRQGNGGAARVDAAAWAGCGAFGSEGPFFEVPAWRRQAMRKERGWFPIRVVLSWLINECTRVMPHKPCPHTFIGQATSSTNISHVYSSVTSHNGRVCVAAPRRHEPTIHSSVTWPHRWK
jgi:hypothetical protein